jgi:hypothetical protein
LSKKRLIFLFRKIKEQNIINNKLYLYDINLMAINEAKTDLRVYDLRKEANISLDPQKSGITELNNALSEASKR